MGGSTIERMCDWEFVLLRSTPPTFYLQLVTPCAQFKISFHFPYWMIPSIYLFFNFSLLAFIYYKYEIIVIVNSIFNYLYVISELWIKFGGLFLILLFWRVFFASIVLRCLSAISEFIFTAMRKLSFVLGKVKRRRGEPKKVGWVNEVIRGVTKYSWQVQRLWCAVTDIPMKKVVPGL